MADDIRSYEFAQQAEVRPPRIRWSLMAFAGLFTVLCVSGIVVREPLLEFAGTFLVPDPEPDLDPDEVLPVGLSEDEQLMYTLSDVGGQPARDAIETIVAKNDQRYASVLLESLIAAEESPGGYPRIGVHYYFRGLMELIGGPSLAPGKGHAGQPLSTNFLTWYTSTDLICPDGYTGWKGHLLSRFHPGYGEMIYEGVPTTIRIEEVRATQDGLDVPLTDKAPYIIAASEAAHLLPRDLVYGVVIDGEARAYPEGVMQWHPVWNDRFGNTPVTVAYTPVSGAVTAYLGRVPDDKTYTFGSSGLSYRSNRLLFDRESRSLWNHLTGQPVVGPAVAAGVQLDRAPIVTTTWEDWRSQFPETTVLSMTVDDPRWLRAGAIHGIYQSSGLSEHSYGPHDERLPPKNRVQGLRIGNHAKAYSLDTLQQEQIAHDIIGEQPVVVIATRGTILVQAKPILVTTRGRRVWRREVDAEFDAGGEVRCFARGDQSFEAGPDCDSLLDEEGRAWKVTPTALLCEDGEILPAIPSVQAYWFAWSQIHTDADLYSQNVEVATATSAN